MRSSGDGDAEGFLPGRGSGDMTQGVREARPQGGIRRSGDGVTDARCDLPDYAALLDGWRQLQPVCPLRAIDTAVAIHYVGQCLCEG
ncbi:hypothetical protein GCM10020367_69280 [Streptomyces sannanensis]|uniref:DUF433 domain-containing protein n=1 Tax=Streptomyces sannanensis TaxID=285536 RepID=A0ABP6SMI1_9ACTN